MVSYVIYTGLDWEEGFPSLFPNTSRTASSKYVLVWPYQTNLAQRKVSPLEEYWRSPALVSRSMTYPAITIIGSDNGLSLGRRQAIIWANAGMLLIGPLGTGFREMLIGIQIFPFTKMRMKMSSAKWRPFCLGLDVLTLFSVVKCHQLNITLYCASTTTAHAFPFRVASMPAVRYDLSGGLPTCLWLFIYQDYSVICISKKLM